MVETICERCKKKTHVNFLLFTFMLWRKVRHLKIILITILTCLFFYYQQDWCENCKPQTTNELEHGDKLNNSFLRYSLRKKTERKPNPKPKKFATLNSQSKLASGESIERKQSFKPIISNPINVKVPSRTKTLSTTKSIAPNKISEEKRKGELDKNESQIKIHLKDDNKKIAIQNESQQIQATQNRQSSMSNDLSEFLSITDIQLAKPESHTYAVTKKTKNNFGSQISVIDLTSDEQVETLTVKQLRGILNKHNVDLRDSVEREDLIVKVIALRAQ